MKQQARDDFYEADLTLQRLSPPARLAENGLLSAELGNITLKEY